MPSSPKDEPSKIKTVAMKTMLLRLGTPPFAIIVNSLLCTVRAGVKLFIICGRFSSLCDEKTTFRSWLVPIRPSPSQEIITRWHPDRLSYADRQVIESRQTCLADVYAARGWTITSYFTGITEPWHFFTIWIECYFPFLISLLLWITLLCSRFTFGIRLYKDTATFYFLLIFADILVNGIYIYLSFFWSLDITLTERPDIEMIQAPGVIWLFFVYDICVLIFLALIPGRCRQVLDLRLAGASGWDAEQNQRLIVRDRL